MKQRLQLKWLARSSIFTLFFILFWLVISFDIKSHLSVSLESILPQSDAKNSLEIYQKINKTQDIVFATKGNETANINKYLEEIKENIEGYKELFSKNKSYEKFFDEYYFYSNNAPNTLPDKNEIEEKLLSIKENLLDGFLPFVNANDPLMLFTKKPSFFKSMPNIEGFDKTVFFKIDTNTENYELIYDKLNNIIPKNSDIFLFSPFFYNVENSRVFKSQGKLIVGFSTIILSFLYLYWLRRPILFIYTATTLLSSAAFSQLVAFAFWDSISVYTIIFSAAISTVSIDYMFHHYLHNAYGENKKFLKPVFYGFFTTFIAFIALSFVNFTLISQIALTSAASLMFSYLSFAFIYPNLEIGNAKTKDVKHTNKMKISPSLIFIFSLIIIFISPLWINFNTDIQALNIKNVTLHDKQMLVEKSLHVENKTAILIVGNSLDDIIEKSKTIKNSYFPISSLVSLNEYKKIENELLKLDFLTLKKDLKNIGLKSGFRQNYFDNAYNTNSMFPKAPSYSKEFLKENDLKVIQINGDFYAAGYGDKNIVQNINDKNITAVNSVLLFEHEIKNVAKELIFVGIFILIFVSIIIFCLAKDDFIRSFCFVLAPLSACLLMFLFIDVLILHIFMIVIIIAMSVDYAIYNACAPGNKTNEAIFYSLLSTIAGFGILAISYISSLQAIGLVALCACFITAALLYFTKAKSCI